jgi:hypothetical protein
MRSRVHEQLKIAATFLACFLFGAASVRELVTVAAARGAGSQAAQRIPDPAAGLSADAAAILAR